MFFVSNLFKLKQIKAAYMAPFVNGAPERMHGLCTNGSHPKFGTPTNVLKPHL